MSDFNSLVQYTVENISRPVKYIIYKLTEFIRVVDKFVFRQVPSGAASGYATIEQIEGNTVKFNQLVLNGDFSDGTIGWIVSTRLTSSVSNNEATFTANDDAGGANKYISQSINYISGHKYLISFDWRSNRTSLRLYLSSTIRHIESDIINTWVTFSEILTNDNYDRFGISLENPDMLVGYYFSLRKIQIIDLTTIFGSGNEPSTVADFEAWMAQNIGTLPYYDYNAGELISCKMSSVKSVGFNQWDEEWEIGSINQNTGEKTDNTYKIRSKNYIKVLPSTTYYLCNNTQLSNVQWYVFFYSANGNYLGYTTAKNTIFTTPVNCEKILFREAANYYGTIYNHDICINLSDPVKNGTYKPYMQPSTVDLSWIKDIPDPSDSSKKLFPYGLLSAGSVHDEVRGNKVIKRVGVENLGNLTYSAFDPARGVYRGNFTGRNAALATGNQTCVKYKAVSDYNTVMATNDTCTIINVSGVYLFIHDLTLANKTTTEVKEALNNYFIYYELATPIEVTFEELDTHPMNYEVEDGGTEQVLPVNTSTPTTVAPTLTTVYTKNVH